MATLFRSSRESGGVLGTFARCGAVAIFGYQREKAQLERERAEERQGRRRAQEERARAWYGRP